MNLSTILLIRAEAAALRAAKPTPDSDGGR